MQTITEIKKGHTGTGLLIENDGYISMDLPDNKVLGESLGMIEGGEISTKNLPRPFVVSAVFQKFGIENANGRIYPEHILKRAVDKYMAAINERRAYGEANHPDGSSIDVGRIAMNIVELHWVGHTLVGKMELPITEGFRNFGMITCLADMVAHWILSGLRIGVSSRGLGSVKQEFGKLVVGDDYEIVCWDVVAQPSTPQAYIDAKEENLEPYIESEDKKGEQINENKFEKFEKWLLKG